MLENWKLLGHELLKNQELSYYLALLAWYRVGSINADLMKLEQEGLITLVQEHKNENSTLLEHRCHSNNKQLQVPRESEPLKVNWREEGREA